MKNFSTQWEVWKEKPKDQIAIWVKIFLKPRWETEEENHEQKGKATQFFSRFVNRNFPFFFKRRKRVSDYKRSKDLKTSSI